MMLKLSGLICLVIFCLPAFSQHKPDSTAKVYRIITSGKQLTVKSKQPIKNVMVWTTAGDRVVEQRGIHNNSCTVEVPTTQKNFFLMVGMEDGQVYTEKLGLR